MIRLSNNFSFSFMAASGSLGFDGKGWPLPRYWLLRFLLNKYPNFIIPVIKTLTLYPIKEGSYRAISDGKDYVTNSVGLKNPGFSAWTEEYLPRIKKDIIISVTGNSVSEIRELADFIKRLPKKYHRFIQGVEFNCSCPNTKKKWAAREISKAVSVLRLITQLPIGVKIAYHQDFIRITKETSDVAEWISFNSVPWEIVFPDKESPLKRKYGVFGAVSGKVIKNINKNMALEIKQAGIKTPVVASSIGWQENIALAYLDTIEALKWAEAVSFGSLFRKHPTRPIRIAKNFFMEERGLS